VSARLGYNIIATSGNIRFEDDPMNMSKKTLASLAAACVLALGVAWAQQPGTTTPSNWLGMAELERIGTNEGFTVTEIETKQRLAEVEGYDAQQRKVKLLVDRQTGEILSRRVKERRRW